jgi:ADP-ribose pyrophosphatase
MVHRGQRISLRVDEFRLGDRPAIIKEIIEHPGSVVVLPLTDDGQVVLVQQWRQAAGKVLLEAPCGTMEPGEDPLITAHRELREETGYRASSMTPLGGSWVAPGYSAEFTHAFVAHNLTRDPLPQDTGEDIHTVMTSVADFPRMIREGELQDQMTIAVYYMAMHVFNEEAMQAQPG